MLRSIGKQSEEEKEGIFNRSRDFAHAHAHKLIHQGGKVGHVTRHVWQLFKVKRSRSQSHAQEIYADGL